MGQGTESCGGYDVDYDPYEDVGNDGYWIQRDGSRIKIEAMSVSHMRNARHICSQRAQTCNFSSDAEMWEEWVQVFDAAIARCPQPVHKAPSAPKPVRGKKVMMICHCKTEYPAREADLKRGQGLSCSKSCAAIRREFGRPAAKRKPV